MSLSDRNPATAIAGIFGATQEARAAKEAMRILNQAKIDATRRADQLYDMFKPFTERSGRYFDQSAEAITESQRVLREEAAQMEVGRGLSAADEIAYKDAARLLNEQMVGTGNLRSGAAAFGQTELLRRVVADANQRNFDRRAMKLQLLYGGMAQGANQFGQLGSVSGNIGLQGQQLSNQLFQSALGFSSQLAGAERWKGGALSNQIMSVGVAVDESVKTAIDAAKAYFSGGMSEMGGGGGGGGKSTAVPLEMAASVRK